MRDLSRIISETSLKKRRLPQEEKGTWEDCHVDSTNLTWKSRVKVSLVHTRGFPCQFSNSDTIWVFTTQLNSDNSYSKSYMDLDDIPQVKGLSPIRLPPLQKPATNGMAMLPTLCLLNSKFRGSHDLPSDSIICWNDSQNSGKHLPYDYWFIIKDKKYGQRRYLG